MKLNSNECTNNFLIATNTRILNILIRAFVAKKIIKSVKKITRINVIIRAFVAVRKLQ